MSGPLVGTVVSVLQRRCGQAVTRGAPIVTLVITLVITLVMTLAVAVLLGPSAASYAADEPAPLPTGTDVDYQLGGAAEMPAHVGIVVRDRTDPPVPDKYNVCYVNGFQTQASERRFWKRHPRLVLRRHGQPVVDEAWGEWLLDIRTSQKRHRLARIVGGWTAGCAEDGYAAVEFDNLDSFTRSHGLLVRRDAVRYARLLVRRAHRHSLAAAQKNLAGWDGTRVGYDFAVAEECGRYDECDAYVEDFGEQVLGIEYRVEDFEETCEGFGADLAVVLRDRDLSPEGVRRWC